MNSPGTKGVHWALLPPLELLEPPPELELLLLSPASGSSPPELELLEPPPELELAELPPELLVLPEPEELPPLEDSSPLELPRRRPPELDELSKPSRASLSSLHP